MSDPHNPGSPPNGSSTPWCPKCASTHVVRIVYGYPGFETMEKSRQGEIELGGCIINSGYPRWSCKHCHHRWGKLRPDSDRPGGGNGAKPGNGRGAVIPLQRRTSTVPASVLEQVQKEFDSHRHETHGSPISRHVTGNRGDESIRGRQDPDNLVDRINYGLSVGQPQGNVKERGVGANVYYTDVPTNKLYDFRADPDGLYKKAYGEQAATPGSNLINIYERMIRDAGYIGYFLGDAAAVFEKLPVTQYQKDREPPK